MLTYAKNYLITLRYTKLLSYISAKYLQQSRQESHKHRYTYYYGFQIIYGAINKGLLLIILGLIFGILPQLLVATLSFCALRVWSGGLHFDSYTKCAYISLICFIAIGMLAKCIYLNMFVIIAIFVMVFIIFLLYSPVEHPNRPIEDNEKIKFKATSLSVLIVLFLIAVNIDNTMISNSIALGVLLAGLIATPVINKIK